MFPEKVPKRLHSLLLTRMLNEFPAPRLLVDSNARFAIACRIAALTQFGNPIRDLEGEALPDHSR